jgi:hypothetical protein
MRKEDAHEQQHSTEVPPPVGGSWTTLYAVVLATLAALIVAFYVFTRAFR